MEEREHWECEREREQVQESGRGGECMVGESRGECEREREGA